MLYNLICRFFGIRPTVKSDPSAYCFTSKRREDEALAEFIFRSRLEHNQHIAAYHN